MRYAVALVFSLLVGGCGLLLDLDRDRQSDGGIPCTSASDCPLDACTGAASCVSGACAYPERVLCNDGIDCTRDGCDPVRGCVFAAGDDLCDDGVECTLGQCDPMLGCRYVLDDTLCVDAHRCTSDRCTEQGCAHVPDDRLCGLSSCDPINGCTGPQCTTDGDCALGPCETAVECNGGECRALSTAPDGTTCSSNDPCALAAQCSAGNCIATELVDACDVCSRCDRTNGGGCKMPVPARDGDACDDADACTGMGTCADGACEPGVAIMCTPRPCNVPTGCDPSNGCQYSPTAAGATCPTTEPCTIGMCDSAGNCLPRPRPCPEGATCDSTTNLCVCPAPAIPCGAICCMGTCSGGVTCIASDGGTPACLGLGRVCSTDGECETGYVCNSVFFACVPSGRMECGGIAGDPCTDPMHSCLFFSGADYGICLDSQELACSCVEPSAPFDCATTP